MIRYLLIQAQVVEPSIESAGVKPDKIAFQLKCSNIDLQLTEAPFKEHYHGRWRQQINTVNHFFLFFCRHPKDTSLTLLYIPTMWLQFIKFFSVVKCGLDFSGQCMR